MGIWEIYLLILILEKSACILANLKEGLKMREILAKFRDKNREKITYQAYF